MEIIQFLLDWRLAIRKSEKDKFDKHWQQLQQSDCNITSRKIAFDIWYFAYSENQKFIVLDKPNWQGLKLCDIRLDKQSENNTLNLDGINLSNASVEDCVFSFTDFSKANLTNTYFRQNKFDECNIKDWINETTIFHNNRFNKCLIPSIWQSSRLFHSNLVIPSNKDRLLESSFPLQKLMYEQSSGELSCFHPDGIRILLGGNAGASLWKVAENKMICLDDFFEEKVTSCEFSPDGNHIIIAGDGGASLWKVTEDKIIYLHDFIEEAVTGCEFSPDGTQILIESHSNISLWKISENNITFLHNFTEEGLIVKDDLSLMVII